MKKLILISLILIGCGKKTYTPRHYIEPIFVTYVGEFESAYGQPIGIMVIEFGPTPLGAIGKCNTFGEQKVIWIDKEVFSKVSETIQRVTIFHELGHCALNRAHAEAEAFSIMAPGLNDNLDIYETQWPELLYELFN